MTDINIDRFFFFLKYFLILPTRWTHQRLIRQPFCPSQLSPVSQLDSSVSQRSGWKMHASSSSPNPTLLDFFFQFPLINPSHREVSSIKKFQVPSNFPFFSKKFHMNPKKKSSLVRIHQTPVGEIKGEIIQILHKESKTRRQDRELSIAETAEFLRRQLIEDKCLCLSNWERNPLTITRPSFLRCFQVAGEKASSENTRWILAFEQLFTRLSLDGGLRYD